MIITIILAPSGIKCPKHKALKLCARSKLSQLPAGCVEGGGGPQRLQTRESLVAKQSLLDMD